MTIARPSLVRRLIALVLPAAPDEEVTVDEGIYTIERATEPTPVRKAPVE